jgi:hypothetical protein
VTQALAPLRPFATFTRRARNAFDLVASATALSRVVGSRTFTAIARRAATFGIVALSDATASTRRALGETPLAAGVISPAAVRRPRATRACFATRALGLGRRRRRCRGGGTLRLATLTIEQRERCRGDFDRIESFEQRFDDWNPGKMRPRTRSAANLVAQLVVGRARVRQRARPGPWRRVARDLLQSGKS